MGWEQLDDCELLLYRVRVGGRVSGWVVRDTYGACMYICLCVSVYVC